MLLHWCFVLVWCRTLARLAPDQSRMSLVAGSCFHRRGCSYTQVQLLSFPSQLLNNEWRLSPCAEWCYKSALRSKVPKAIVFYAQSHCGKVKNVKLTRIIWHWEGKPKCLLRCFSENNAERGSGIFLLWSSLSYPSMIWQEKPPLLLNKSR